MCGSFIFLSRFHAHKFSRDARFETPIADGDAPFVNATLVVEQLQNIFAPCVAVSMIMSSPRWIIFLN